MRVIGSELTGILNDEEPFGARHHPSKAESSVVLPTFELRHT